MVKFVQCSSLALQSLYAFSAFAPTFFFSLFGKILANFCAGVRRKMNKDGVKIAGPESPKMGNGKTQHCSIPPPCLHLSKTLSQNIFHICCGMCTTLNISIVDCWLCISENVCDPVDPWWIPPSSTPAPRAKKRVFRTKHCQRHYGPRRWLLWPVILVW